jgi:Zn-dependent M28 family amino/carboxypeptidase
MIAALLASISLTAQAQNMTISDADLAAAARLRDRALKGTMAWETVAQLSTEVGPRSAGSPGDRAAVVWAVNRLTALGFSNVRTQDVTVPHWERGQLEVAITAPYPQKLVAVSLGGSIGTPEEGVTGDIVNVADVETLEQMTHAAIEGRIVYIRKRMQRTRDVKGYGDAVRGRTAGASAAARLGARAIVIRSVGTDSERYGHTGTVRYEINAPKIPAVALSNPDADLLEQQLATGKQVTLTIHSTARELPPERSANVIGELPGATAPEEIVLLGAHLDSWDLGTGAIDDGAGVAIVTEAVRLIREMQLAPRRTLRVVLFANEEYGLSGANAYAEEIGSDVDKHVFAMEADLGAGPVWRFDSRVPEATLGATKRIMSVLRPLGIERGDNTADGGSDIGPLRRQGVPVFFLVLDATRYFDFHHTPSDTLDKVDRKALDQSVAAHAVAAFLVANAEGSFGRLNPAPDEH